MALTCAEDVKVPNSPNTNPAMAMAAMSVIAIKITVARTGEIAFLRLLLILKMVPFYDQVPENATDAPLLRLNWPTACEPTVCPAVAAVWMHVTVVLPEAGTVNEPVIAGVPLQATAVPAICSEPPVTATLDVPVLVRTTVHWLLFATEPVAP